MLFGYPSALAYIARHAERRQCRSRRLGDQGGLRDLRMPVRSTSGEIERCSAAASPTAMADATPDSSHTNVRRAAAHHRRGHHRRVGRRRKAVVPPGESGEIVVTHLATRRLSVHSLSNRRCRRARDRACLAVAVCRCSRVPGTHDRFRRREGRHGHARPRADLRRTRPSGNPHVYHRARVAQRTRVSIVPEGGFDDRLRTTIREGIQARLGRKVRSTSMSSNRSRRNARASIATSRLATP